ncbi:uncharacterized protein LOC111368989 [Olea europaea var. sylvestris]|uniref:uncharacterized protein LOC111368989 n=1 Tax=Olea europaea var. sylvestris TaxID=158386 RepID=UPI000C1CF7F4|nr:uncharacterized protein LOC111368989 [Olea europaea var. sylvestris]
MDLDLALWVDQLAVLTDKSTSDDKREKKKWEQSNRISLMVMKRAIPETFRSTMSDKVTTTKGFLENLEKRSKGYKFYDPTTKAIFETENARLFEDVKFAGEKGYRLRL